MKNIATFINGYTFRQRPEDDIHGAYRIMQIGDLDIAGHYNPETSVRSSLHGIPDKFFLYDGDIVFRGRGAGFSAVKAPTFETPIAVASPLIKIQVDQSRVNPDYLVWYLNSAPAQKHLWRYAHGTKVMGVGKKELEALEVPLPTLEEQDKIAQSAQLLQKEIDLLDRIKADRQKLINNLLLHNAQDMYHSDSNKVRES